MKKSFSVLMLLLLTAMVSLLLAQTTDTQPESGGGIDWFQLIVSVGYIGGVFVLLPLVLYTNQKSKLFDPQSGTVQTITSLTEEERNERALQILDRIGEKLTPFTGENGEELITITKGSQARFMKRGLDYINKFLSPSDPDLLARIEEFKGVYEDRAQRAFTGSKWIIGCSAGLGLFMLYMSGFSTFIVIHFLGLAFYIVSSRTTMYTIEKRLKLFGGGSGLIGGLMGGLFLGAGAKHYVKHGDGPWKRDYEGELQGGMIAFLIIFVVAMFLGFLAAALGVVNFFLNYSTSFLNPLKKDEQWYQENFELGAA
jgi:hypothetical protein